MMAKNYTPDGMRLTDCCGAFSTFSDVTLCCKVCWEPVPWGQGDGTEYLTGLLHCDGCDEKRVGVARFRVTHHDNRRTYAHYCPGCLELAKRDWNGNTLTVEPSTLEDPKPWIPEGGMVGRQWP